MIFIKKIVIFFKNIFQKKVSVKMIEAPVNPIINDNRKNFIQSLRINMAEKSKKKIETLTCFGDGLGIQKKLSN